MRKGLFFSSLVIAAGAAVALHFYWNAPASTAIYGTLTSTITKKPLGFFDIEIESVTNPNFPRRKHMTDEKGWFSFEGLPDGVYRVTAYNRDRSGHVAQEVPRGTHLTLDATFRVEESNR
jgi:hypothetical protein